jgi:hypothetical protein
MVVGMKIEEEKKLNMMCFTELKKKIKKKSMWTCHVEIIPREMTRCASRGQMQRIFRLEGGNLKKNYSRVKQNSHTLEVVKTYLSIFNLANNLL